MSFRRYALERIAWTLLVFVLGLVVIFLICQVGNPGPMKHAHGKLLAHYLSFRHENFLHYLWRVLGRGIGSDYYGIGLGRAAFEAASVTLSLVGWAFLFAFAIAVPLGWAWDRKEGWTGKVAKAFVYLAISLSPIFVGIELSEHLGFEWHVTPISGYADFFGAPRGLPSGPGQWAYHLLLPGFVLALPLAAVYTRVIRAQCRDLRRARSEAAPAERETAIRNARETAAIIVCRGILRDLGAYIGAAALVETVFNLPGLGTSIILALNSYDAPLIEAILIAGTAAALVLHLAGNLVGAALSKTWRGLP